MKTKICKPLAVVCGLLPLLFASCSDYYIPGINGEGEIVESTVYLDDFDGFVSTIGADIFLTQGDTQEVVIRAQENIIDNIVLDVNRGIWTIEYYEWVHHAKPVKIFITIPDLTKAAVTGSGNITGVTPFYNLGRLELAISGSGDFDLETESNEVDVRVSGLGNFELAGETKFLDILISGSGNIDAFDLETEEAEITISGSGNAFVDVEDYLNVMISGSGSVFYRGTPEIDSHITGSGTVRRDR